MKYIIWANNEVLADFYNLSLAKNYALQMSSNNRTVEYTVVWELGVETYWGGFSFNPPDLPAEGQAALR